MFNIFNLIIFHPYQYVYFNLLFEKNANKLFEIDYWGVANKDALKNIVIKARTTFSAKKIGPRFALVVQTYQFYHLHVNFYFSGFLLF